MSDETAGQMAMILAALQSLQTEMQSLQTEMQGLRTGSRDLQAELYGLRTELKGDIVELRGSTMARVDRWPDALTTIREDIGVSFAAADTVRRANDNTREEVRALNDVVGLMRRRLRSLEGQVRELRTQ